MGNVVAAAAYADGRRVAELKPDQGGEWARRDGCFVWIGLYEPDEAVLRQMQREYGLHDLAVEDALHAHQRPKLEVYGDSLFLVLRTAHLEGDRIAFGETHIFAGEGYVITVRHGASASYTPVRTRCESSPRLLRNGVDFVLYALMDFVVDNYFPIIDAIEAEVTGIEDGILARPVSQRDVERTYQLRRELLRLRRVVSPLLEVCSRLERFDLTIIDPEVRPYFADVHDHVIRINEGIDTLREVLTFSFEASLMLGSARQNEVTKKLAAWAAILAVPTAVAGIYGMNFDVMPELRWHFGYPATLLTIAVVCLVLYVRFRRTGWL